MKEHSITIKELAILIRQHKRQDGAPVRFRVPGTDIEVHITAEYVRGTGAHGAWKYLYFLTIDGKKQGGYDRFDSFASWAVQKIGQVSSAEHSEDLDCDVDPHTLCCKVCGVDHSGTCAVCGGHGFHKPGCQALLL